MFEELGKLEDALKAYQAAFTKYAPQEYAYFAGYAAGAVLARLQRPDEAEKAFAATVEKYPGRKDLDRLYFVWAGMNYDHKRYARGDELYRQLFTQFPASPYADDARLSVAESDLVADPPRYDGARKQFTDLAGDAKVEPRLQERALYQISQIEIETKRWEELRKVCRALLDRFPSGPYRYDARFHLAEADFQTEAFEAARDGLAKLRDELVALRKKAADPNLPVIKPAGDTADTGSGTVRDDDPAQKPWYPRVWVMLAETQFRLKQYPEVEATVAEFKLLLPKSDHTYFLDEVLGRTFKAQAKFDEARAAFERVVADTHGRLTETAAKSQFHLGETYLLQKDYKHALAEYLKVEIRYKFPEWQGASLLQAAACYEALNEWKDAAKTYEDLLRQFPEHAYAPQAKERLAGAKKRAGL
jgi:TolA-binding protein